MSGRSAFHKHWAFSFALASCQSPHASPPPPAFVADAASVADAALANAAPDASTVDSGAPAPPGMLLVPGGTFEMGTDRVGEDDERPAHAVTLASFFLDATEVTREAYEKCTRSNACARADETIVARTGAGEDAWFHRPNQPIIGVTWEDAHAFCAFVGKRLPREAEFERAVRGNDGRRYPWGNSPPTNELAVFGRKLGKEAPEDVASHPSGKGPYGHFDLAGNVWEWVEDDYDPYAYRRPSAARGIPGTCTEILKAQDELRREGRQGFTGSNPIPVTCEKVLRGGAFNYDGWGLRSTNRVHHPRTFHLVMAGFRCAKDAPVLW